MRYQGLATLCDTHGVRACPSPSIDWKNNLEKNGQHGTQHAYTYSAGTSVSRTEEIISGIAALGHRDM
jgi:hypothetical protein